MRFSYAYKTSDGIRRESRISADTRDDAFRILREQGIKPIKVVSLSGSKANGEEKIVTRKRVMFFSLFVGLMAGMMVAAWFLRTDFRDSRIIKLDYDAHAVVERHRVALATLHMRELRDYEAIAQSKVPGFMNQKIILCRNDLNVARDELRSLFQRPFSEFADNPDYTAEVERLYTSVMDEIDLVESRLDKDVKAYRLLETNRGKWTLSGGNVVFSDRMKQADFQNLTREIIR